MKEMLEKMLRAESLTLEETHRVFEGLIRDEPPELKAAVLTALRAKGETVTEILGMAQDMRRLAVGLPPGLSQALDTCGTGGDGAKTLNLSTLAAVVLSAMGVPIVKHGNRSVSSSCGSADLLEKLGLPLDLTPNAAAALFQETRFTFLFAPHYHPAMKAVSPVRKALQIRTIFNFLGPLANPAKVLYQVVGVPGPDRVRPFADVLKGLGLRSALVVHGEPGIDEISPCGKTTAAFFLNGGPIQQETWSTADLGISEVRLDRLRVSGVDEAVRRARDVLAGTGPEEDRQAVAVNVAAGLLVWGRVTRMPVGVAEAKSFLSDNRAAAHWDRIVQAAARLKSNA